MFLRNIDRFLRYLTNTPSVETLLELEQSNPERFEKIRQAHNKVLLKEINKQLKKSLILYFHPYTTSYIMMVDWTGLRPLQMGWQDFTMSSMPMDIETGRLLKAGKIIFHHPVFLSNYYEQLFELVNREDEYGIRIHGRRYQNPTGRIISGPTTLSEPNPFLYIEPPQIRLALHDVAAGEMGWMQILLPSCEVRSSTIAAQMQEAAMRRQDERRSLLPDNALVFAQQLAELGIINTNSFEDMVRRRVEGYERMAEQNIEGAETEDNGYPLPSDFTQISSVRERIFEQTEEEEPSEEVADLLEKIDTLLEDEDEETPSEDYIPRVAPRL